MSKEQLSAVDKAVENSTFKLIGRSAGIVGLAVAGWFGNQILDFNKAILREIRELQRRDGAQDVTIQAHEVKIIATTEELKDIKGRVLFIERKMTP